MCLFLLFSAMRSSLVLFTLQQLPEDMLPRKSIFLKAMNEAGAGTIKKQSRPPVETVVPPPRVTSPPRSVVEQEKKRRKIEISESSSDQVCNIIHSI